MFTLINTNKFAIIDIDFNKSNINNNINSDINSELDFISLFGKNNIGNFYNKFSSNMLKYGGCLLQNDDKNNGIFNKDDINKSIKQLKPLIKYLKSIYDPIDDEFYGFDLVMNNVVRIPRINRGKHNIHFNPEFSYHHKVLETMAENAKLPKLLELAQNNLELNDNGYICKLREIGLSMTRPLIKDNNLNDDSFDYGSGMEMHSDGCKGEYTVLMSLDSDIEKDKGALLVVPRSHLDYIDGIGHDPSNLKHVDNNAFINDNNNDNNNNNNNNDDNDNNNRHVYEYAYRESQPIVIDARTIHGARSNISSDWRVICWYIYETFKIE
jgi:hypothetical protein